MLRRCLAASFVLVALGGFVLAETIRGVITKTDIKDGTGTITVRVRKDKEDKKGTEQTVKVTKSTKFQKRGKDKNAAPTKAVATDLTSAVEKASKAEKGPKGVMAKIETDDSGHATTITFGGRPGGKRPPKDK